MVSAPSTSCESSQLADRSKLANHTSYDPAYEQWEFGKLSALREIALTSEGGYNYYYMGNAAPGICLNKLTSLGYYIHSCQKMRYKGNFRPQYILGEKPLSISQWQSTLIPTPTDPESHTWEPLDGELSKKLDERPYVSLSHDRHAAQNTTTHSDPADAEINDEEVSLFDLHMPGVLTLEQVKALDLDHWLLLVHGTFVHMNVSST